MSAQGGAADAARDEARALLSGAETEVKRLRGQVGMFKRLGYRDDSQQVLMSLAALRTAEGQVAFAQELLAEAQGLDG